MKKLLAMLLVAVMTLSVVTISGATEVSAASKKVKSIKVTNAKNKKVSLVKGKTKTLKVKVKVVGKASKKFTVKSSKKSVVTAKKSGKNVKLTAKAAGTAKVTIKSKANKKKKTVIKVTVTNPVVPTENVKPIVKPEVTPVAAKDYILDERVEVLDKNVFVKDIFVNFDFDNDFTVSSTNNLPDGLSGKKVGKTFVISGTPSKTGVFKATIVAKDNETKEKQTGRITFIVGSDKEFIVYMPQVSGYYYEDAVRVAKNHVLKSLYVVGGSGDFDVKFQGGNASMFKVNGSDDYDDYVEYNLSCNFNNYGTFKTTAVITDTISGKSTECEVVFAITQAQKITGKVTDMSGNGVEGAEVAFRSAQYYHNLFSDLTNKNGEFTVFAPRDSYTSELYKAGILVGGDESNVFALSENKNVNFKIQGYTVKLIPSDSTVSLDDIEWYNSDGSVYYGSGSSLFFPSGSYSISGENLDYEGKITDNFTANATFTVNGAKTVTVTTRRQSMPTGQQVSLGTNGPLTGIGSDIVWYEFTPTLTGEYDIRSISPELKNTFAYIYDSNGNFVYGDDNGSYYADTNGRDFLLEVSLTGAKKYYIAVGDKDNQKNLACQMQIDYLPIRD